VPNEVDLVHLKNCNYNALGVRSHIDSLISSNRSLAAVAEKINALNAESKKLREHRDNVLVELGAHMINNNQYTIVVPIDDNVAAIVRLDKSAFSSPSKLGDEATVDLVRQYKTL